MLFHWKLMCALLVIQLKSSEILDYSSPATRHKATFTIMWLIFQLLIAFPICFTQFLIGQYGKRAMIRCWEISPIICGIGYSMLLMAVLYMTYESQIGIMTIEYAIISIRQRLPWCECSSQSSDLEDCIPKTSMAWSLSRSSNASLRHNSSEPFNLDLRAFRAGSPDTMQVSAYHYFTNREKYIARPDRLQRLLIVVLFWVSVSALQLLKFKFLLNLVPIGLILILALAIAAHITVYIMYDMGDAIEDQSTMDPQSFIQIESWTESAVIATESLCSGTGYMIFFGTYLQGKARPDLNAAFISAVKMVFCIFLGLFFVAVFLKQKHSYGIEKTSDTDVITGKDDVDFGIPLLLAFLCDTPKPQIFSIVIFIAMAVVQYVVVCLEMSIMIKCLYDSFVTLHPYRIYVVCGLGLLMLTFELAKFGYDNLAIMHILYKLKTACTAILMILYTFFVHILYGPARLSSDMELIVKAKTPTIWIFMWAFSFVLTVACIPNIDQSLKRTDDLAIMLWILLIIIILPIVVIAIILYFRYLKHHVLFNLIRPTENWKPQDYDEADFEIFDYRKEVMFKIPHKVCEHLCIQKTEEVNNEVIENLNRRDRLMGGEGEGEGKDEGGEKKEEEKKEGEKKEEEGAGEGRESGET